jgi:hypothetical protein
MKDRSEGVRGKLKRATGKVKTRVDRSEAILLA